MTAPAAALGILLSIDYVMVVETEESVAGGSEVRLRRRRRGEESTAKNQ